MKKAIRQALVSLALTAPMAAWAVPAAAVEPGEGDPGVFKRVFENHRIRILEVTTEPGQAEGWHSHPRYFAYVISGGRLRHETPDGETSEVELTAGMNRMLQPVEWHQGVNIGDSTVKILLVELKKP